MKKIWDKKRNKSPLKVFSESVEIKLQKQYDKKESRDKECNELWKPKN